MTESELKEVIKKAKKWDALGDKIAKCYDEPDYDRGFTENDADLCTIGELTAKAYGFL